MNRLTLQRLEVGPHDDVLEIGFGGGELLAWIRAATDGEVTGIDVSDEVVERARTRFGGGLRVFKASVESLPLADGSVDKACSVNNVYFWPDPAAGMEELARVIRPGGRLAISFEPPEELRKWPGHRFGFRAFDEAEVRGLMEQAGFIGDGRAEGRGRKPDFFLCLTGKRDPAEAAS